MRIEASVVADAGPGRVWRLLVEWERQPAWMVDAVAVEVLTPTRAGVGVTIRCPTRLFGVTVDDVMRVTAWDPPHHLGVVHLGWIIRGRGGFDLHAAGPERTRITWWEEVDPPLGRLGAWGAAAVVRPLVAALFRRSLANLARLSPEDRGS